MRPHMGNRIISYDYTFRQSASQIWKYKQEIAFLLFIQLISGGSFHAQFKNLIFAYLKSSPVKAEPHKIRHLQLKKFSS